MYVATPSLADYLLVCLFMAVLGLHCPECTLVVVRGLLIAVASLVAGQGL